MDDIKQNLYGEGGELMNPIKNTLAKKLKDTENRIQALEVSTQPYLQQYFSLSVDDYERYNNTTYQTTENEILRYQVGQRINFKHSIDGVAEQRFGIIYDVDLINYRLQLLMDLAADASDLTFWRQAIIQNPVGFPNAFIIGTSGGAHQLSITVPTGTINPGLISRATVNILNSQVFCTLDINCTITSGTPSYIQIGLPISGANTFVQAYKDPVKYDEGSSLTTGYASGSFTNYLRFYKDSGVWGANNVRFTHSFFYFLDSTNI